MISVIIEGESNSYSDIYWYQGAAIEIPILFNIKTILAIINNEQSQYSNSLRIKYFVNSALV